MNNNLTNFANFNQTVGAICESTNPQHIDVLFQTYVTFGIFLAQNNMVDTNFKVKEGEAEKPASYLG